MTIIYTIITCPWQTIYISITWKYCTGVDLPFWLLPTHLPGFFSKQSLPPCPYSWTKSSSHTAKDRSTPCFPHACTNSSPWVTRIFLPHPPLAESTMGGHMAWVHQRRQSKAEKWHCYHCLAQRPGQLGMSAHYAIDIWAALWVGSSGLCPAQAEGTACGADP